MKVLHHSRWVSRRAYLATFAGVFALPMARAQDAKPWSVQVLRGNFDGTAHQGGLRVTLAPHWKTYWRMPGNGGIPPEIKASGPNLAGFAFSCPLPTRINGQEGQSIGYLDDVVFPFAATPQDPLQALDITLEAFIGVCDTICIPVPVSSPLSFPVSSAPSPDITVLKAWQARVPREVSNLVTKGEVVEQGADTWLHLTLSQDVDDVFVEGAPTLFFGAPHWLDGQRALRVQVSGSHAPSAIMSTPLRVTAAIGASGLEQVLHLV